MLGYTDADFLPRLAAERLRVTKLHVIETREPQRFELPVNIGGEVRWFDIWIDPDLDPSGLAMGVYSTIIDVSAQKRREVQLRTCCARSAIAHAICWRLSCVARLPDSPQRDQRSRFRYSVFRSAPGDRPSPGSHY